MRLLALLTILAGLAGCVSETGGPEPRNQPAADTPGPVDRAQTRVRKLIERSEHQSNRQLLATLQEIIYFKQLALEPVLEALAGATPRTQANLLYCLGFIGGEGAHRAAVGLVSSTDPAVRYEAAAALLNMGDWGGVPTLLDFMDSEDRRERYKASQALSQLVKKDFGYQFDGPLPEREKSMTRWRKWWTDQRQALIYGAGATGN